MIEKFIDIKNALGYEVSNFGYVRRKSDLKILNGTVESNGYIRINFLMDSGNSKRYSMHRLVYFSFNNESDINDTTLIIDHIDRNKQNNMLDNLRLVNTSKNILNSKFRKIYNCYDLDTGDFYIFDCPIQFSELHNLSSTCIYDCVNNKQSLHKNFIFGECDDIANFNLQTISKIDDINTIKKYVKLENLDFDNKFIRSKIPKIATNIDTNERFLFKNVPLFSKTYNLDSSGINKCLKGNKKFVKNFIFEYSSFDIKISENEIIKL